MAREFQTGDDLLFQLESGYGLLRVLAVEDGETDNPVWHLLAYGDFFLDGETAEKALQNPGDLKISVPHMALTNRAFERTPTAKLLNRPLSAEEISLYEQWKANPEREIFDRSVLLMLGLR